MIKIRNSVFETNSSSVHSISIDKSGLEKSNFKLDKNGYIHIDYGSFDKYYELFATQYEKLSYLITCCYYIASDEDGVSDTYEFGLIQEAITKYTNCNGIIIDNKNKPYIDHQSIPYDGIDIINIYDEDAIINFVFNKYIRLQTTSD